MRGCRHGGEPLDQARRLRATGALAAALDAYLDVLAEHPAGVRCRRPILMEAAHLAHLLECPKLTRCLAGGAFDEATNGTEHAQAWTLLAEVDARTGNHERAAEYLRRATDAGSRSVRQSIEDTKRVADVLAGTPSGPPGRGRGVAWITAQVSYASALHTRSGSADARQQYAAAATALDTDRTVRRLRGGKAFAPRGFDEVVVALLWATAVAGQVTTAGDDPPGNELSADAAVASAVLTACGLAYQAARLNAAVPSAHLCWYLDADLVEDWTKLVDGRPDRGWLTQPAAATLTARLADVYGRLSRRDPENFARADIHAVRTVAVYADRIDLAWLALEASRAEVDLVRRGLDAPAGMSWSDLAWALRRHAICLNDVDLMVEQIPVLTEAAELHREHSTSVESCSEVRRFNTRLVELQLAAGQWDAAVDAAVTGARRLAAMTASDAMVDVEIALETLERRARRRGREDAGDRIAVERTELWRLLAERDPAQFADRYLARLVGPSASGPPGESAAAEAIGFARRLASTGEGGYEVLLARTLADGARAFVAVDDTHALALLDEAVTRWRSLLETDRAVVAEVADAYRTRAGCLLALDRTKDHVDCLLTELELRLAAAPYTDPAPSALFIADALRRAGEFEPSVTVLSRAIDTASVLGLDVVELRLRRARCLAEAWRGDEALQDLEAIPEQGESPALHAVRGLTRWTLGQPTEALEALATSLALRPDQHEARHLRGVFHLLMGNPARALAELLAAVRAAPDAWDVRAALADTYVVFGDADAAVREGRLAVDLDPSAAKAHASYAVALLAAGYSDEASAELHRAIDLLTDRPAAAWAAKDRFDLVCCHAARNDVGAVTLTAQQAFQLNPHPHLVAQTITKLRLLATAVPATAVGCDAALRALR